MSNFISKVEDVNFSENQQSSEDIFELYKILDNLLDSWLAGNDKVKESVFKLLDEIQEAVNPVVLEEFPPMISTFKLM